MSTKPRFLTLVLLCLLVSGCAGGSRTKPAPVRVDVSRSLLEIFPQRPGTTWRYDGFAEYGHGMRLVSVRNDRVRGRVTHTIEGLVDDMSGGESRRDFRFKLEYIFTRSEVRERIIRSDTPFPHEIDGLILLRLPLRTGTGWRQQVKIGGHTRMLRATLTATGTDAGGRRMYTVRYRVPKAGMPGGVYEEVRLLAVGKGVVGFEKTFGPSPEERFGYALNRIEEAG